MAFDSWWCAAWCVTVHGTGITAMLCRCCVANLQGWTKNYPKEPAFFVPKLLEEMVRHPPSRAYTRDDAHNHTRARTRGPIAHAHAPVTAHTEFCCFVHCWGTGCKGPPGPQVRPGLLQVAGQQAGAGVEKEQLECVVSSSTRSPCLSRTVLLLPEWAAGTADYRYTELTLCSTMSTLHVDQRILYDV